MKPIAVLLLGMGIMSSAVVQAQQPGQGSAVPRPNTVVAQAPGTGTTPGSPVVAAPAALPPGFVPVMSMFALGVAGVAVAGMDNGTTATTHH